MMRLALVAVAVTIAFGATAHAQSDSQVWTEAGVSRELSDATKVGFGTHLRFDDSASRLAALMPEVFGTHRVTGWLRIGTGYRLQYKRDDNAELGFRHRLHLDARVHYDIERVRISYRFRAQNTQREFDAAGGSFNTIRSRAALGWRRRARVRPSASVELFHRVGDGNGTERRALRLTVAADIDMDDYDLSVFYRHETPYNDPDDVPLHIFGVGVATEL